MAAVLRDCLYCILENFSSYENRYEIDLTTDESKPIILIGGQNGAGKTSLFTAIKLGLYGPLAFGYSGVNTYYFKKIKTLINSSAFQNSTLVSGITVEFFVINGCDKTDYSISRYWHTADEKIVEDYRVIKDGTELDESDKYYFENYLHTIIPPELFDFFLFDGEEIGNVFSGENYNKYVKSAMLTLCGIDVFAVVQNFCRSYIGKTNDDDSSEKAQAYEEHLDRIDKLTAQRDTNAEKLAALQGEADELSVSIIQKEQEFTRAGGISPEATKSLEKKKNNLDEDSADTKIKAKAEMVEYCQKITYKSEQAAKSMYALGKSVREEILRQLGYEEDLDLDPDPGDIRTMLDSIAEFYEIAIRTGVNLTPQKSTAVEMKKQADRIASALKALNFEYDEKKSFEMLLMFSNNPIKHLLPLRNLMKQASSDCENVILLKSNEKNQLTQSGKWEGDVDSRFEQNFEKLDSICKRLGV